MYKPRTRNTLLQQQCLIPSGPTNYKIKFIENVEILLGKATALKKCHPDMLRGRKRGAGTRLPSGEKLRSASVGTGSVPAPSAAASFAPMAPTDLQDIAAHPANANRKKHCDRYMPKPRQY